MDRLAKKLQALKYDLKMWNKETLGNEDRNSQQIARDEFSHCAILEEISWRQKSRALWLKKGDSNTKFFHRMANARRKGNFISSMTVKGVRLDKEEELKESIGSFFKSLFEESRVRRPNVESGLFKTLDSLDNEILEGQFSEKEVSKAFSNLREIRRQGRMVLRWRSGSFVGLYAYPEERRASDVQDFRPISLMGSLYKIMAKVLANRLKRVMGKVVSYSQNAFVGGRQILDAVLVANELIDSRKRNVGAVNGTPTDFFSTFRGLRQGDPLSPYLFVLTMEAFSSLISRAEEKGFIKGFKDNRDQLDFWNGGVEDMDRAAAVFGCKVGNLPTTYLGLPLGAPHNSCRVWDVVEERFKRNLATWKKQYLSKGGRLTLIKSTLSNIPIYFMSLFVIPRKMRLRLEKIQMEFLWGDLEERRKIHLVRWTVICKDKRYGGLGLRHLKDFNYALLRKWLWRFPLESESFWRKVIIGKFGEEEGG
ncbi:putative ribonuclease H protein [Vitis vinifera]|uniref:Putative ribonuclease H protein n=1 Tax=Vitis vinifera TaxID=29760 RepID=A0A438EY74_VITVI|nr:putative ribonuclease H protein [Vitis vinifera]